MLSANCGWLTMSPTNLDRKHPVDRHHVTKTDEIVHQQSLSKLSPVWMQDQSPPRPSKTQIKVDRKHLVADTVKTIPSSLLKAEKSRSFFCDIKQPPKSIFNIGDARHNIFDRKQTELQKKAIANGSERFLGGTNVSPTQYRLHQWDFTKTSNKEPSSFLLLQRQARRSREVTGKIGSFV